MENLQLQELDAKEMLEIDGGKIPWKELIAGAVAAYDALTDFVDGFAEGWNEADKKYNK